MSLLLHLKMKCLGVCLMAYVQDLYTENKKILVKEIKDRYAIFVDWKT